jgi:predicted Fe-S protein YdhL (DUF1289 family)
MFNRTTLFVVCAVLSSTLAFGCNRAADEEKAAAKAQAEADQEIAEAAREARDKAVSAQSEADKKISEAQANFMGLREGFRHEMNTNLLKLDQKIADLESSARAATGAKKTELESKLVSIREARLQFSKDYQTIEGAFPNTWDATKAKLEKQWSELSKAVDDAS